MTVNIRNETPRPVAICDICGVARQDVAYDLIDRPVSPFHQRGINAGHTYEQFKRLPENHALKDIPMIKLICENHDKIYNAFVFIKKQNDAREYLIALHYNRELRYYAEHPNKQIAEDSILNEYITRNIALLIRKLWSDTNKFI